MDHLERTKLWVTVIRFKAGFHNCLTHLLHSRANFRINTYTWMPLHPPSSISWQTYRFCYRPTGYCYFSHTKIFVLSCQLRSHAFILVYIFFIATRKKGLLKWIMVKIMLLSFVVFWLLGD